MYWRAISSRRLSERSRAIRIFILRMFFARLSSASGMGSLRRLSSSSITERSSAEWEAGPSTFMPKRPESVKWLLMAEAELTNACCCIMFVTARAYIPFPGPPLENPVADPTRVFMTWKAAMSGSVQGADSKTREMLVSGDSVQVRSSPPTYSDLARFSYSCSGTGG